MYALSLHRARGHAGVDLVLAQQEDDQGGDDGDEYAGADVVILTAMGPVNTYREVETT